MDSDVRAFVHDPTNTALNDGTYDTAVFVAIQFNVQRSDVSLS